MAWTLNDFSLGAWGISRVVLRFANQQADTLSFVHDGVLFDGELLFAHGAAVTLKYNGVVRFAGKIRETPRMGRASAESIAYVAYGAWNVLERLAYLQDFAEPEDVEDPDSALTTKPRGRVILGQDGEGEKIGLTAAIEDVFDFAEVDHDVDLGDMVVPYDEATDYSCADALTRLLQWAPDAVVWYDYAGEIWHVARRADLDATALAVAGGTIGEEGITLNPRYDLVVDNVCLIYIATNRSNAASWDTTTRDVYPPGTTGEEDNAFVRTIRLAGSVADSSFLTQKVETRPIPAALDTTTLQTSGATFDSLLDWWKKKHPWLVNEKVTVKGFRLGKRVRVPATGDENDSNEPTAGLKELIFGALTDWMIEEDAQLVTEQQNISIEVAYDLKDADDDTKLQRLRQKLESSIIATNAQSKTYSVLESSSFTEAEEVPEGLARALYDALHPLQWEGTIMLQERECTGLVGMGEVVNLTGSRSEWATMSALPQSITLDLDQGQTVVQVGPPAQLGVDSLVEIFKNNRTRPPATSTYNRATGSSAARRRQSLPTWQPIRAAQSGTAVAPRTYTAALDVAGTVPTAGEITTAIQSAYTGSDTPIFGDTIALTVAGTEKFRARVSSTGTPSGLFTVAFAIGDPAVTYHAQVVQTGLY